MTGALNETIVSEGNQDAAKKQSQKQYKAISDALNQIDNSSDLLRTIQEARHYNRLQILSFAMSIGMIIF